MTENHLKNKIPELLSGLDQYITKTITVFPIHDHTCRPMCLFGNSTEAGPT